MTTPIPGLSLQELRSLQRELRARPICEATTGEHQSCAQKAIVRVADQPLCLSHYKALRARKAS